MHVRAQTAVTLTASVSPTSGQPNVHNIVTTGSNFPAGTIVPADVIVTLQPQTAGAGPSASTAAKSVAIATGTIRRITFTIPAEVVVATPTAYHVSVTGRTTDGATFSSSNRANLTVNPPAKIVSVTPPGGAPGASLSVAITTQYTNFMQGATQASFGPGISVGGAAEGAFGPVTVHNPTSATAQIAIGQAAPANARAITVRTGVQNATLANAFTVATSNRAPTANAGGPYSGVAEQPIGFSGTATDPDNDTLTFTWNFGDQTDPVAGLSPMHTYAAAGDYTVSLTVADGRGGSVTVSTTVTVAARPNLAPVFTSTPLITAKHRFPFTYQATANDPDGDALAFSVTSAPEGLTIGEASGIVEWTPAGQQLGLLPITLTVTDARGAKATQSFSVTVADVTPPIVTLSLPSESLPGKNVTADAQAIDNVGVVSVRFEVNGSDASTVTVLPYERAVVVPVNAIAGTEFHVRAIATDAAGNSGQSDAFFKVAAVPDTAAPTITLNVPPTTTAGSQIALVASPQDNVGVRSVTFRLGDTIIATDSDAPFEATYAVAADAAVGSLLAFTARATDFSDNIADASDSTEIVATPDTTPPTVQLTLAASVLEGDTLTFSATAKDNVGVAGVEFFANGVSAGTATLPPYTGSFALPTAIVGGDIIHVEARARDFAGLSASDVDHSTVLSAPNRTPTAHAGGPYVAQVGAPIELSAALSSDPDQSDELVYHWSFGDDTTGSGLTPRHAFAAQGTFTATLTVDDGRGGVATATATIVVSPATDRNAPSITLIGPSSVLPASQVTMTAQASDDVGVVAVTFAVNGANPTETALQPYQRVVDVPGVAAPGDSLKVTATARDAAGNEASAEAVLTITGAPDTQNPTVSLIAPPQIGAGTTLRLSATAEDDVGVESVTFIVNGSTLATLPAPPYEVSYPVAADATAGSSIGVVVQASDYSGNRGDANGAVTVVSTSETDTTPPTVTLTAPLQVFAGRTLPLSASAKDNVGVASVRFFVDNVNVATLNAPPFEFDMPLGPSHTPGSLLQLRAVAVDFSDLEGAAVAQTLVAATDSAGQGVLSGEVYDDAVSLPLAGATVTLAGTDGTGAPYTQSTTTDARGRWSLRATEGDGGVQITRAGWTRVDRPISVVVDRAVEIFDARLTRLVEAGPALSAVLGGQITTPVGPGPPAQLSVPPGALTTATALALTPLSPQGLGGVLPPGWSPIAAADVTPHGIALAVPATLALPNAGAVPAGSTLVLATWDATAGAWRAHAIANPAPSGNAVTAEITRTGQYAVLLADTQPLAPAQPPIGDLVAGVAASALDADVSAVVDPQPKVLFYQPGVRSEVHGRLSAVAPVSSGAPIEARISESYHFHNGTDASPEPFVEDLFFYQAGASAPGLSGAFNVTPSQTFEALSLRQGVITVELLAPPPGVRFADALGADGGAVTAPTGERLQIPQGALAGVVPVSVRALTAGTVGVTLPPGLTLVGSVLVNLVSPLAKSATLSVPKPAQVTDASRLLLVRAQEIGGETRLLLVGRAVILGNQVVSELTLNGAADAFEGVRTSGRYLFVSASSPIGFAQGRVTLGGGAAAAGALVSSSTLPVVALSRSNGNYIEAASTGPIQLTALDLPSADKGAASGLLPTAGSVIALDVQIAAAVPTVTAIVPVDGAANVPLASPVVISFSRPIDPASVNGSNAGNVVLTDPAGTPVVAAISLANNQTTLTLRPSVALQPNTIYTVRIGTGVADFVGRHLPAAVTAQFTSLDTAPPPMPAAGSIAASIPNASGITTITATQGSAGVHDTVTIVNLTKGSSAPALVNPDGSFTGTITAGVADKLQIAITDQSGNQTVVRLMRFTQTNADGSVSASIGADGGRIVGPGGVAVEVPFHALPEGTIVTVAPVAQSEFPVTLSAEQQQQFRFSGAVSVDFGEAVPSRYVNISIPAAPGDPVDGHWIVGQVVTVDQTPRLNVVDTAKWMNGRIRTSSPPCPGVTARGIFGIYHSNDPVGVRYADVDPSDTWEVLAEWAKGMAEGIVSPFFNWLNGPTRICVPVGAGRATITENAVTATIAANDLPLMYREVTITNHLGEDFTFARNVVEPSFTVAGRESDTFEVIVDPGSTTLFHFFRIASVGQGQIEITLDPDHLNKALSTVVITNVRTAQATSFTVTPEDFKVKVAGGTSFQAKALAADGTVKTGIAVVPSPPDPSLGSGNLVLRVRPGTIDPKKNELPPGDPRGVIKVTLKSPDQPDVPIDLTHVEQGGLQRAFDGDPTHRFYLWVDYENGNTAQIDIPRFRVTIKSTTTGRVIRTIRGPAPPPGEPLSLGKIADDDRAPVIVSGPTRLTDFDPLGTLAFRFSRTMDPATLTADNFIVEEERSGTWVKIKGTVKLSEGNTVGTFVPKAGLKLGQKYRVSFANITSSAGQALLAQPLELTTFEPKRLCGGVPISCVVTYPLISAGKPVPLRDLAIHRKPAAGGTLTTNLVAITDTNSLFNTYRLTTFNVTDPENVTQLGTAFGGAGKRRLTIVPNVKFTQWRAHSRPCAPPGPAFAGDLVVTTSYNNHSTFLTFYDITNLNTPCDIGGKTLTWNPDTQPFEFGAYRAVATAQGITTLTSAEGPVAYAAVSDFAMMGVDVRQGIADRPNGPATNPDNPVEEGTFAGNYWDVAAVSDRLVAIERTTKKLDIFDGNFSLLSSLDLPDTPRRLVVADDWPVDLNADGKIAPLEMRRVAFVGSQSRIQFVDITDLAAPQLLGHIPMPATAMVPGVPAGMTRELDADSGQLRLYAGTASPTSGDALYVIDGSNLLLSGLIDEDLDSNHWDDRILWSLHYPKGIGGMKADGGRGLLYVAAPEGLDIISLADRCCDLGVDFTSQRVEHAAGPVAELIVDERAALKKGIENGLAKAAAECGISTELSAGDIWILEQGSGACVWRGTQGECSPNYQPGVSDHDYEVFFPEAMLDGAALKDKAYCTTTRLTEAFNDELSGGNRTFRFNDITFYPMERERFARSVLNIRPIPGNGTDASGDMGLGRQQLLFGKFLAEGQYVDVAYRVQGRSLSALLGQMTVPGGHWIPRIEGHEWAILQKYGLIKSKAFIRIVGASSRTSAFHEFYIQQLHGAGKAGIRAAMARMVADTNGNNLLKRYSIRYWGDACLTESTAPLANWASKRCGSFEEFVAAMAAREHLESLELNRPPIFTEPVVRDIQRFYRVKADLEVIPTEIAADAFVVTVAKFIDEVISATEPIYNQLIVDDAESTQRLNNLGNAHNAIAAALNSASFQVIPRVFNIGFRDASRVQLQMYRIDNIVGAGNGVPVGSPVVLDAQAASERFMRDQLIPRVNVVEDVTNNEQNLLGHRNLATSDREPYFRLTSVDLADAATFSVPRGVAFTIDLPDRTVREANRRNNIGGFFYYVLDRNQDPAAVSVPATPTSVPVPQNWNPEVLEPDVECTEPPTMTVVQAMSGGHAVITVKNTSTKTLTNIGYCIDIGVAPKCVDVALGPLAPNASGTFKVPVVLPDHASVIESTITLYAVDADGHRVAPVVSHDILVTPAPFTITMFDASPLAGLTHPFSRYRISHMPGSAVPKPIFGAVTDGEPRSIRIAIEGLSSGFADLSITDADVHTVVDGIGGLSPASASAVPVVKMQVSVDGAGRAEVFYTPPAFFIRPAHQNRDFDRAERQVTLSVNQNGMTSTTRITLRRPPVFLVHGLWGTIAVWDELRPLLPESSHNLVARKLGMTDAVYFKSRLGFGDWYDVFNVGSAHASNRLTVEVPDVVQHIRLSLENNLSGYAIGKVDLVAHSMGGMISRKMVNENAAIRDAVRKLIIINSPLRGSPLADKVVATRDAFQGLLASLPNPVDLFDPSPSDAADPTIQQAARNTMCEVTLQSVGRTPWLNIFNGAVDDLRTEAQLNGQPTEVGKLIAGGNQVPTHLFITTTTGADLGYSLEVSSLWTMLGIFCNWTPDTNTTAKTELVKIGAEAVGEIAKAVLFRGGRSGPQMHGMLRGAKAASVGMSGDNSGPPIPIFGSAPNDRVVPVVSQLEDLLESSPYVTSIFGNTDHQDIKSTGVPVGACVHEVNGIKQIKTPFPAIDIDGDGQTDAVCHIVDMLERDPKGPKFRQ